MTQHISSRKHQITPKQHRCVSKPKFHSAIQIIKDENGRAQCQSNQRHCRFQKILSNSSFDENASMKYACYGFGSIVCVLFSTFFITLIPVHNLIKNPNYWFELPLQATFAVIPFVAANTLIRSASYTNMESIKTHRNFQKLFIVCFIAAFSWQALGYSIWTQIYNIRYPIPLNGYVGFIFSLLLQFLTIWFIFPAQLRKNDKFRQRLKSALIVVALNNLVFVPYAGLKKMLLLFPKQYQWIISILLPLVRHFNIWLSLKWLRKAINGDFVRAEIVCNQAISSSHALMVAYIIGSVATFETSVAIFAIDFLINIYICIKMILLKQRKSDDVDKQIQLLQELVISEMVEVMIPITYLLTFIVAYHGPNAELIGNVRNGYWQYTKTEDVKHTIEYVFMFFLVDVCSLLVSAALLWCFCRINLYRAYSEIMKEFGTAITIQMGSALNGVSKYNFFRFT